MAHSTNFLNQEFTFVAGTIVNNGDKAIVGLQVNIEFHDQFNQTILRDSEMLIQPPAAPLPGRPDARLSGHPGTYSLGLESAVSFHTRHGPGIAIAAVAYGFGICI